MKDSGATILESTSVLTTMVAFTWHNLISSRKFYKRLTLCRYQTANNTSTNDYDIEAWFGLDDHKVHWSYCPIIGKIQFLKKCTCPELACPVHQAAQFSANPKLSHMEAVHYIERYLIGLMQWELILQPNDHSFEVYADANFSRVRDKDTLMDYPPTVKSRYGYVIVYARCPILWTARLQSEI
jgi:hypothetical protein